MQQSRRCFMKRAGCCLVPGGIFMRSGLQTGGAEPSEKLRGPFFKLFPIGRVEREGKEVRVRVFEVYSDALLGLSEWSHVNVLYWFDRNDTPEKRSILMVHPRGDRANPRVGVFACRAPVRPNLIALTVAKILSVEKNVIHLQWLDAFHGTPVLDLKPFIPPDFPRSDIRVPAWARGGPGRKRP